MVSALGEAQGHQYLVQNYTRLRLRGGLGHQYLEFPVEEETVMTVSSSIGSSRPTPSCVNRESEFLFASCVALVLEGALALQLASVWTWRLWRKNPWNPLSDSFLDSLRDMVRNDRSKSNRARLLFVVWLLELGSAFVLTVCMVSARTWDSVVCAIVGGGTSATVPQFLLVVCCCAIEICLMVGALLTHVQERHPVSESLCAISVLAQSVLILLFEYWRHPNLWRGAEEHELAYNAAADAGILNFAAAICGVADTGGVVVAASILAHQDLIAFFIWTLCTAMVCVAWRAGLYRELWRELCGGADSLSDDGGNFVASYEELPQSPVKTTD